MSLISDYYLMGGGDAVLIETSTAAAVDTDTVDPYFTLSLFFSLSFSVTENQ